jgi:hypothetical protein
LLGAPLPGLPEPANGDLTEGTDAAPPEPSDKMKPEETVQVAKWLAKLWGKVFVNPGLSLKPTPSQIHPDWIPEEDQQFIWQWIRGEVTDTGEPVSAFPGSVQG